MLTEKEVQTRVNRRLSGLAASQQRQMRIRTAIYAERTEAKPMKRTISKALAIALVAVLLLATIAIAEHFNLFNFFGEREARYSAVAPHATLTVTEPAQVKNPELGTATATIDSAYFDGLSLNVAYRITNAQKVEQYTPTEAELARMQEGDADALVAVTSENEPDIEILRAWNAALESGTPYGYRKTAVYTSDHTVTEDGVDIFPDSASPLYNEQGEFCEMRTFECPLPEEVSSRQELKLHIDLYQETVYYWFDGAKCYWQAERTEAGTMTATIPRNAEPKQLSGTGTIHGVACDVTAKVSPMATVVTFKSAAPFNTFLQQPPTGTDEMDCWVEAKAVDETGKKLRPLEGCSLGKQTEYTAILTGTGEMPEQLTFYLYTMWEGMEEPELSSLEGIVLNTTQP